MKIERRGFLKSLLAAPAIAKVAAAAPAEPVKEAEKTIPVTIVHGSQVFYGTSCSFRYYGNTDRY